MDEKKKELLKVLEEEFKGDVDFGEVSFFTKEELNSPVDILRAEIAEFGTDSVSVLGEFFFLPLEDDGILYFTSVITLSGTVPEEVVTDLCKAVAKVNYLLPTGCFALGDHDKNLVFRLSVPVFADDDVKRQELAVSNAADTAVFMADRYEGFLKLVINNEMTVDEMIETVQRGG